MFLREHPEICSEIEKQVRIHYHLLPEEELPEEETGQMEFLDAEGEDGE